MPRLIDADDLMDWSETVPLTAEGGIDINDFEEKLKSMPTIDAEPHWIPCSERLPEKNGYYLTTTCYRQVYCDYWNEDHFDRTEAVIAWMPLPKPYEE